MTYGCRQRFQARLGRVQPHLLRGGQQVVARVPYPMTDPKYYAVASEVATIEYLRSCGIPAILNIYGYPADSDNIAGTPYILIEFVHGPKLSEACGPVLGTRKLSLSSARSLSSKRE